jgi:hypothetical protein
MKRYLSALGLVVLFGAVACNGKSGRVEKFYEHGVEVIDNHLKPYETGGTRTLSLAQEFVIDLASNDLVQQGLTEPAAVDLDDEGNIYVWSQTSAQNFIFKFDSKGNFVSAFGRSGQGPGELRFPTWFSFDSKNEIMIVDPLQSRLVYLDKSGGYLRQRTLSFQTSLVIPLADGKAIVGTHVSNPTEVFNSNAYGLYDSDFKILREIGRSRYYKPNPEQQFPAMNPQVFLCASANGIFFADSEAGYEIKCFDLGGELRRIIRKKFSPVPLAGKRKEALLNRSTRFPPEVRSKVVYPATLPPFQTGFADEAGRLFVMTYEEGSAPGEYWHDVFNADGLFVGRVKIDHYGESAKSPGPLFAMARGDRIFYLRERRDGFKELVVCAMNWSGPGR